MTAASKEEWNIGMLPFVYKELDTPTNGHGLPDRLPFTLTTNEAGVMVQKPYDLLSEALKKSYHLGSTITGMMDDDGIGKAYTDDFISMIINHAGIDFSGKRVLDIGCGTGYLLYRLKQMGAEVIGVEPGKQGEFGAKKYGVTIVSDFFPSPAITGRFDVILMYNLLEHIEDPTAFINKVKEHLNPKGKIIMVVEDEESYIDNGDISFLFHEHYSYFTKGSLFRTFRHCQATFVDIRRSNFSQLLFAVAGFEKDTGTSNEDNIPFQPNELKKFREKAEKLNTKITAFTEGAAREGKTIAFYVPSRVINVITLTNVPLKHVRFIDDNPVLENKYYPAINIPIESGKELFSLPTDYVVIYSSSFGERILQKIRPLLPPATVIKTLADFYES